MTERNPFAPIEEAIDAIAQGRVIIVVDDEDRENEGDFVCAAEKVTPEIANFMLKRAGGGMYCVPILPERARALDLDLVTHKNTAFQNTAFTVSCDLRTGSTGISAIDRAATTNALADPSLGAEHFVRPGHVHPIVAKEGGVLRRAGHTEAAVDLCRLAGLQPVGTIIEILDDDGTMARRDRLVENLDD